MLLFERCDVQDALLVVFEGGGVHQFEGNLGGDGVSAGGNVFLGGGCRGRSGVLAGVRVFPGVYEGGDDYVPQGAVVVQGEAELCAQVDRCPLEGVRFGGLDRHVECVSLAGERRRADRCFGELADVVTLRVADRQRDGRLVGGVVVALLVLLAGDENDVVYGGVPAPESEDAGEVGFYIPRFEVGQTLPALLA